MSYSFTVKGATKAEAIAAAGVQFDSVLAQQPVHSVDMPAARETAEKFVNLLGEDDSCDTTIAVNGSVWTTDAGLRQASVNVNVGFSAPR